jgi:hypothetical protein
MPKGVFKVVFEAVAVFEDALAEVAVVLVVGCLLDVVEERRLAAKLLRTNTAPVLVLIIVFIAAIYLS